MHATRALSLALLVPLFAPTALAQTSIVGELVASGFDDPLWVGSPPTDASRLFVVEQDGLIHIIEDGAVLPTPFLDIDSKVNSSGNERGLLGFCFHPDYASNGLFYVNYTRTGDAATIIERYSVSAGDPNLADAASGTVLLSPISQPFSNHNSGGIAFGPDGKLYICTGDGGASGDPSCNAQNGLSALGKILRVNDDGSVPADNPFVGDPTHLDEIWAKGLRNPYRFSFDRQKGDLYIGDVGQNSREEISFQPASSTGGENYGWKIMEGFNCFSSSNCGGGTPSCNNPALTLPIHDYSLSGPNCAVMGGYVYRGCNLASERGKYFFADHCSARIWSFSYNGSSMTGLKERTSELDPPGSLSINSITSFGQDANGELYIVDRGGEIFRIVSADPTLLSDVSQISVSAGGTANFSLATWDCTFKNDAYLLLASGSGSAPGFTFDGINIPLNQPDPFFSFSLGSVNLPPYSQTFGTLNAGGKASASLTIPAGAPVGLVGVTLEHAYVVFDLDAGGNLVMASDPVSIQFGS